jgi:uncharacterized protein (DUF927 family)
MQKTTTPQELKGHDLIRNILVNGPPEGFVLKQAGLYRVETDADGARRTWRVCDPIEVMSITHDKKGEGYGRWVTFRNIDGKFCEMWIDDAKFVSGATSIIAGLRRKGFRIAQGGQARSALLLALQDWKTTTRYIMTNRVGWHDDHSFVLPDGTVIGSDQVRYHGAGGQSHPSREGSLDGWREEVAARALGNPLMLLAISVALSGPLMHPLDLESGGVHFRGWSGKGKSTLLKLGSSVWAGPRDVRPWRTTDNRLELDALKRNGTALFLDEIAEVDGRAAEAAGYLLGNGEIKGRASAWGAPAPDAEFRVAVLSSGEISFATKLAEAGRTAQAGHAVRLLDIPADQQRYGVFETLHDQPDGRRFSEVLKGATARHYGHAGPKLVERLAQDQSTAWDIARAVMLRFHAMAEERFPHSGGGLAGRARTRLAGAAAAGELATAYGITGWPRYAALEAVLEAFGLWLGGRGNPEVELAHSVISRVQQFLNQYDAQISNLDHDGAQPEAPVAWRKGGHIFIPAAAWLSIFGEKNGRRTAHILHDRSLLELGDGRNLMARMPVGVAGPTRGFKVSIGILQETGSDMSEKSEDPDF